MYNRPARMAFGTHRSNNPVPRQKQVKRAVTKRGKIHTSVYADMAIHAHYNWDIASTNHGHEIKQKPPQPT